MVRRDDFEIGDGPIEVERKPRAGVAISVRLSPDEADRLQQLAEERGITISQLVRQALGAFLRGQPARQPALPPWTSTIAGENCKLEVAWFTPRAPNAFTRGDPAGRSQVPVDIPERISISWTG